MTLFELIANRGQYHKSGGRYVGPCPYCGGSAETTRFVTKIGSDTGKCFSCGKALDTIGYLREFEGMTCKEAHAAAGRDCDKTACPAWDKCKGTTSTRKNSAATATVPRADSHRFTPSAGTTPADRWQQKATALIDWAHDQLLSFYQSRVPSSPAAYLAGRGLDRDAVSRYRLGWIPSDLYRERAAWGLPAEKNAQGRPKKLWLPRGIVIPSHAGLLLNRIRIRRPNEDLDRDRLKNPGKEPLRYYAIPGSGNDVAVIGNPAARAVLIVESDLDGLLVHHLAGDLVAVIPLTTCSARPKPAAAATLDNAAVILVSLDSDKAGAENWHWWHEHYPQAVRWPVPAGKDQGEAYQSGIDLRAWIIAGLPVSLHPVAPAFAEPAAEYTAPVAPAAVTTIRTRDGRQINLTDHPESFKALAAAGRIVFTSREMGIVQNYVRQGVAPENLAVITDVKAVWPGARVLA